MDLPQLNNYRSGFIEKGLQYPLSCVPAKEGGLLNELPAPAFKGSGWPWTEETDPGIYSDRETWPRITIVTPSFNQGSFIEETIRSVLLQNYPNLEYIIMDGGSSDQTNGILQKYSPWLSFWQSEKDNGQGHAINMGFSLASGDYYAWINSDDYYLKNVFHMVVSKFLKSKADFIYGFGFNKYFPTQRFEQIRALPFWDYFIKIPGLIQPSTFWRAGINQPIWEELHCSLDFELWLRLAKGKKKRRIKKALSVANIHIGGKTSDPEMKEKWNEDHLKIWSENGHGPVPEWNKIMFLNRIRVKIFRVFKL